MVFDWFDLIVLFGIVQGLLAACVLIFRVDDTTTSKKLLTAILLVFSMLSGKVAIHTLGLWSNPDWRYFPLAIDLLIQPLLYLYVASLVQADFKWEARTLWHFLPSSLFFIHALTVYVAVMSITDLAQKDVFAEQWRYNFVKAFEDDLSVISTIVYGFLSFRMVRHYRTWLNNHISDSQYPTFNWLKNILLVTALLGVGLLINIALDQLIGFNATHFLHWQLFYLYLSCLLYYVAFRSFTGKEVIINQDQAKNTLFQKTTVTSKYSGGEIQSAKLAILDALEQERLYLNNELTLQMLANHLKMNPTLVSEIVNKELGKSFRTLINDFRIDEVKRRLTTENISRLSILGIALECDFNSEASFYRLFKAATGQSPKGYMEQNRNAPAISKTL